MKYISTRDTGASPIAVFSAEAIKTGLAHDGGLFMPTEIPKIDIEFIDRLAKLPYEERAFEILSLYLTDYDKDVLLSDCKEAYSDERFPGGAAQLFEFDENRYSLELWHGPTCAFKDMALQIMPRLLSSALKLTGETRTAHILVATSGDTGKAALEGYRDVDNIKITVFFPVDGVSDMQKMQMTTQLGGNVDVCAVEGNFDDAQTGVKKIFSDKTLAKKADSLGFFFSSANSINWGRLVPQIVYYFSAYCDLVKLGKIKTGDEINICVPTGNFGNIFAACLAKEMGLPVKKFICASNSNCVLTDFLRTGKYDRKREFFKTMSPSMDILISSNLERLLYLIGGAAVTSECMKKLSSDGEYTVPDEVMAKIRDLFVGYYADEDETAKTIKDTFEKHAYLCDTHTAVAVCSHLKYVADTSDNTPCVIASTASPYKFAGNVCRALGNVLTGKAPKELLETLEMLTNTVSPKPLTNTLTLPVRFTSVIDPADMPRYIFKN